jgi:hypothetical protein
MKLKKQPICVTWFDSRGADGWQDLGTVVAQMHKPIDGHLMETIGWLIGESDHAILVGLSYDPMTDQVNGFIEIPRLAIVHESKVRIGKCRKSAK